MSAYRGRTALLAISLVLLLLMAGCSDGSDSPTTPPTPTPPPADKAPAEEEITAASSLINQSMEQHDKLEANVSLAESRGVSTGQSSTYLRTAASYTRQANDAYADARLAYGNGDYQTALTKANEATANANASIRNLRNARDALEREYQLAVSNAEGRLQTANEDYQIAQAYVQSANDEGAEVSDLTADLESTRSEIQDGVAAITGSPPNPEAAETSAANAIQRAESIQTEAVAIAREAKAAKTIQREEARLNTEFSEDYIRRSLDNLEAGRYDAVEDNLENAQYAEQLALYEAYVAEVEETNNVSLSTINRDIQTVKGELRESSQSESESDFSSNVSRVGETVDRARVCIASIEDARAEIESARQASTLLAPADVGPATRELELAVSALDDGNYNTACSTSERAKSRATTAEQTAIEKRNSNPVIGLIGSIQVGVNSIFETVGLSQAAELRTPNQVPQPPKAVMQPLSVGYQPPTDIQTDPLNFESGSANLRPVEIEQPEPPTLSTGVQFEISEYEVGPESGFLTVCAPASATLRNSGDTTATNVVAEMRLLDSEGNVVEFSSGDTRLKEDLGTIQPGESKSVHQEICIPAGTALRIEGTEVKVVIDIYSNQRGTVRKEFTQDVG